MIKSIKFLYKWSVLDLHFFNALKAALAEFAGLVATRGLKALISYSGDDVMVQYEDVSLRPLVTRLKRWG